jgi:transcriptional regulator with PAS, ATPase and Fis domain
MASGTKIRLFTKLLDAADAPLWVISPSGRLAYLSAGCAAWLGVSIESLIDRQSIAGAPVSDDPLDRLAASLSPPSGLSSRGTASLRVQPPATAEHRPDPIEVRFVRVGSGDQALTVAVGGGFTDRQVDHELQDAVAIRQRLDAWRKQHADIAKLVTAGDSAAAKRMRRRLQVAARARSDIGFIGSSGCGSESIATRIHQLSAPGEPLVTVDGPLMDAELLEATLASAIHPLTESSDARATTLVRGLDEMPFEAQQRLAELVTTFGGRLRLLGLCGPKVTSLDDPDQSEAVDSESPLDDTAIKQGVHNQLIEVLSALTVTVPPLTDRTDDLPLLATALIDRLRAEGETSAERINRAALDAIVIYPWPGNYDELAAAIQHAARRASSAQISVEHLPLAIRSYRSGDNPAAQKQHRVSLDDAVARFEMRLIEEAIEAAGGNRAEAARRLGISRARLLRKIDDAGKQPSDD